MTPSRNLFDSVTPNETQPALVRTPWALSTPELQKYYDEEWGQIVSDETALFERLSLECFQSSLSWLTILRKRPAFRIAFEGFNPDVVSTFGEDTINQLLMNASIVRNRLKIRATIANAQAVVRMRANDRSFSEIVWSHLPETTPVPNVEADIPTQSPESTALARDLKSYGFCFVGPTNMYALMCAIGMVDAHVVTSHRRGCSGLWDSDGRRTATEPHAALTTARQNRPRNSVANG